ncbi:MAG TPA: hypothetical protein VE544_09930 [Nitrososphaeraceae archaeon]|nr:hypothetical protein [Nitrososphaeraceae archaeon]
MIVNCNMCGRMFRSERRLNKHIMKGKCKSMKDNNSSSFIIVVPFTFGGTTILAIGVQYLTIDSS